MILTATMDGITKATTVLSILMKVFTIPYQDWSHINVLLVLQSCTDSLQVMADSSNDTFPISSDGDCHVGSIKAEEDMDMQEEEKEEVNVKTEKCVCSEEVECMDIKDEEPIYSEEAEEEDIDTKEDKDVDVKDEVSCGDKV